MCATRDNHADGLESMRGLSDAAGNLTDSYAYDAYGMVLHQTGATANPYLYRGEQYDADLSAYYLRARSYQPDTGRFLTTDPVEGLMFDPISLHRYVYGNDNPVSMIDPSGEMSLNEGIVTAAIISNLSAIAIGTFTQVGQQAYADFGEYIFPDAFAVGISGYVSANLSFILSNGALSTLLIGPHMMGGGGGEALLSVSSGEIGFYKTWFLGGALGLAEPYQGKFDLYKGLVWNLWNARNYDGPFYAFSLSLGNTLGSAGGFWDAQKGSTQGAWGVGRTIMSKGWPNFLPVGQWTFAFSRTSYKMFERRITLDPAVVTATIIAANFACNVIENWSEKKNWKDPYNVGVVMFETSMWLQTGIAKHYWGKRMPEYSYEERRKDKPRPPNFRSGPGLFAYGLSIE